MHTTFMKVISVVGYKNTGKTTLVTQLVTALSKNGKVGTLKNMYHHRFNPEDTDTGKYFDAGAMIVTAITENELVIVKRNPTLTHALDALADSGADFAIIEGIKTSNLPKIVLGELNNIEEVENIVAKVAARDKWDIPALVNLTMQQNEWITLDFLIKQIKQNPNISYAGAIGTFTGIVRQFSNDIETQKLYFEKYEHVAEKIIDKISKELMQREGIIDVRMHHRSGIINASEDIIYIVIAAAHRHELFPALSDALETLKVEVPVWKKEMRVDGNFWVHDVKK